MDVSSSIDSVTVYREGAVCLRKALVEPAGAATELRLPGLPLSLTPGSLRARVVKGPADLRILDVRPSFDVVLADALDESTEKTALDAALEEASRLDALVARLDGELAELEGLRPAFPTAKKGDPPRDAAVGAVVALADFVDARLDDRFARRRALWRQAEDAQAELKLRERRFAEASSAHRTESARVSRCALVSLSQPCREPVELALEYEVPGVRWVPNYQLKLDRGFTGGALVMRASIAQDTGEDWTGVRVALSTASLARRTDVPELRARKLGRTQAEPPRSGWREPPPGLDALFESYDDAQRALAPSGAPHQPGPSAPMASGAPKAQPPRARGGKGGGAAKALTREQLLQTRGGSSPPSLPPPPAARMPTAALAETVTRARSLGAPPPAAPARRGAMGAMDALRRSPMKASRGAGALGADGSDESSEALEAPLEEPTREVPAYAMAAEYEGRSADEPSSDLNALAAHAGVGIDAAFLDYARLVMAAPDDARGDGQRGRLRDGGRSELAFAASVNVQVDVVMRLVSLAEHRAAGVGHLAAPASCRAVSSVGSFDYRYDCAARLDVPSTGTWLTVPVMDCKVGLRPEYVCVPSVEPKVYRTLLLDNPTPHALLPGPVDVSAGDEFLLVTTLPAVPPGADTQRIGLGVEEAIKVARKTHYKETTGGFLGNSTVLPHEIVVEIANRLGSPAKLEVRERVPFVDPSEKDLKVEETSVTPPWEKVTAPVDGEPVSGMRLWKLVVPPGGKTTLTAQFSVRIPTDKMLVGGNRRV